MEWTDELGTPVHRAQGLGEASAAWQAHWPDPQPGALLPAVPQDLDTSPKATVLPSVKWVKEINDAGAVLEVAVEGPFAGYKPPRRRVD